MDYYNGPNRVSGRARQRHIRRKSGSANGLVRGCLFLFTLSAVGMLVAVLIVGPLMFRLLPDNYQAGIARRVPIFVAWMYTPTITPTRPSDFLPTADPARALAGQALLDATDGPAPLPSALFGATATSAPFITTSTPAQSGLSPTLAAPALSDLNPTPAAVAAVPSEPPTEVLPPATEIPLPPQFHMTKYEWVPQTWNNCGPANLTQVLNGYGVSAVQADVAAWLKPNKNDANVSPWQLVEYVKKFTRMRAVQRVNGNIKLLKQLMVAKFRPIIETGLTSPKDGSWEGHYLTPIGYDDSLSILFGLDTLLGAGKDNLGVREEYSDLDTRWAHFNRVYVVVYDPAREDELRALLGNDADPTFNAQGALGRAKQEAKANPSNPYAWFNMGSSYVLLRDYRQAAAAYDQSRNAGNGLPWRMTWYQFGIFSAYFNVGDYQSAEDQIDATLVNQKNVEEVFYWRGLVESARGSPQQAMVDFNNVLAFNPNYKPAADALASLRNGAAPVPFDTP